MKRSTLPTLSSSSNLEKRDVPGCSRASRRLTVAESRRTDGIAQVGDAVPRSTNLVGN